MNVFFTTSEFAENKVAEGGSTKECVIDTKLALIHLVRETEAWMKDKEIREIERERERKRGRRGGGTSKA